MRSQWIEVRRSSGCVIRGTRLALFAALAALSLSAAGCRSGMETASIERPVAPPPEAPRPEPESTERSKPRDFEATAYSLDGKTASGVTTQEGVVAADPSVLPIGSRIRVSNAGAHSGEYVVADTGRSIKGNKIDIYIANESEAVQFGRRTVQVEVLDHGKGPKDENVKQLAQ